MANDTASVNGSEVPEPAADLLDRGPEGFDHVVRFESGVRGYRKPDVDAYVTTTENRLAVLREKAAGLEARVRDAEWRAEQAERASLKWRQKFEDSAPPFEELGTHVAEMLASAEQEARRRKDLGVEAAAETERAGERRAQQIIAGAEDRAREIEAEAQRKVDAFEREYDALLDRVEEVRRALRSLPTRTVTPED